MSPVNIVDSGISDFYAASMASGSAWRAFSKRSKNSCMASAGTRSLPTFPHQIMSHMMQDGPDRNACSYAGSTEPLCIFSV